MDHREAEVKDAEYSCAYCGKINTTFVDPSQGNSYSYIEDCQVCCRPNLLNIHYDEWTKSFQIRAEQSQ